MFLTTIAPTWMRVFLAKILAAFSAAPADPLIGAPTVQLYTAGPAPWNPDVNQDTLTEADFVGYAAQALTLGATPINNPSGEGIARVGTVNFVCTAPTTPNTILGYYVFDADGALIMGEAFPAPVPIANAGDFIDLDVVVPVSFEPVVSD